MPASVAGSFIWCIALTFKSAVDSISNTWLARHWLLVCVGLVVAVPVLFVIFFVLLFALTVSPRIEALKALSAEFGVGKSSTEFIARARKMGANDFDIAAAGQAIGGNNGEPDSHYSTIEQTPPGSDTRERELERARRLDRLEAKFRALPEGTAQITVYTMPPSRSLCRIKFKDGKVIASELLDVE